MKLISILVTALISVGAVAVPAPVEAGPFVFNVDNQLNTEPVLIDTSMVGGNVVVVLYCSSANGAYQQTITPDASGVSQVWILPPPDGEFPEPSELGGLVDNTGWLCVANVGRTKGNGFFQTKAKDCFFVVTSEPVPPPRDLCWTNPIPLR